MLQPQIQSVQLWEDWMLERIEDYEFKIIDEIGKDLNITQRKISRQIGLSLGMTNILIKRLIRKGYVKVKGLNRRNVQYILTPQGFAEKVRKTHRYLLNTRDLLTFLAKYDKNIKAPEVKIVCSLKDYW